MATKLGDRVKRRLRELGLTQRDLSKAIGLEPPQVSRILSGNSGTTPNIIVQMANFLKEPETEYIRLYGDIAPSPDYDPILTRIVHMYHSWTSDTDRELFLSIAEFITRKEAGENDESGGGPPVP